MKISLIQCLLYTDRVLNSSKSDAGNGENTEAGVQTPESKAMKQTMLTITSSTNRRGWRRCSQALKSSVCITGGPEPQAGDKDSWAQEGSPAMGQGLHLFRFYVLTG